MTTDPEAAATPGVLGGPHGSGFAAPHHAVTIDDRTPRTGPAQELTAAQAARQSNRDLIGRYAPGAAGRDESATELIPSSADAIRNEVWGTPVTDGGLTDNWDDPEFGAEILAFTQRRAKRAAERVGYTRQQQGADADDIAQDALLDLVKARAAGRRIENQRAYLSTVAKNVAAQMGDRIRKEDRAALVQLRAACERHEQIHDRAATALEVDAFARDILERWPDRRHLPSRDFYRRPQSIAGVEVNVTSAEDAHQTRAGHLNDGLTNLRGDPGPSVDASSWTALAMWCSTEDNQVGTLHDTRMLAYAAMAERARSPQPRIASIPRNKAYELRHTVADHGGAASVVQTWMRGEDDPGTEALFAPFGDLEPHERDQVCNVLTSSGSDGAQQLWDSAIALADRRNMGRVERLTEAMAAVSTSRLTSSRD